MKKYIRTSASSKNIEYKKKFINDTIKKIRRGTATSGDISTACNMIDWLWRWKVIDREESGKLADMISDAMEGKFPEDDWDNPDSYFKI